MKLLTLITASSVTATAFAGEPAPMAPAPAPAPTLGGWFVGGAFGLFETDSNVAEIANYNDPYGRSFGDVFDGDSWDSRVPSGNYGDHYGIDDFEFEMYSLHIGRDLGTQVLGCDLAAYFEVGYITGDATLSRYDSDSDFDGSVGLDLDIIPITINLKAERMFFAGIKGYISAGVGYAFTQASYLGEDEKDGGFYAQASIGLGYDINEQWEIFGGARWLYLSDLDFGYGDAELDDTIGYEIGLRYNF